MPSFVLSMELNDKFREYFLTVIPPVLTSTSTTSTIATYPAEVLPPAEAGYTAGTQESVAGLGYMAYTYASSTAHDMAVYTINKVYMGITRLVYRAETYATPLTPTPLPFTSAFTAFDVIKYKPKDTDKTQRITFSVTRDPVAAIIFFKARDTEYYPTSDNSSTVTTADSLHWFNNRWWPNNRQITRVSATRDGIELAGINNDALQWAPTSAKRVNRERMVREARILAGENTRGQNNMFALDADEFLRCPYYVVKFDNIVRDPGTYSPTLTEERSTSSEYTLSIDFDAIDTALQGTGDPELSSTYVISPNMQLHELQVMLIQQHTFVSNVKYDLLLIHFLKKILTLLLFLLFLLFLALSFLRRRTKFSNSNSTLKYVYSINFENKLITTRLAPKVTYVHLFLLLVFTLYRAPVNKYTD